MEPVEKGRRTEHADRRSLVQISASIALIIVAGAACYGNSLGGSFVWDDAALVTNNTCIRGWSNLPKIFTKDLGAGIAMKSSFYRPLQMLTYMMDYSLWGLNPAGYHLTNMLLHILCALCVWWLADVLFGDRALSALAALLFVVHPVHTEAVTYISGRADSLGLVFMLAAFVLYVKQLRSENTALFLLMTASYICALLSRENTLILPALVLVYHYAFRERLKARTFLALLAIALAYLIVRVTALRSFLLHASCPTTLAQRMPGFFVAVTNYVRLLFLPFHLHMDYGEKVFRLTDIRSIIGMALIALILLGAYMRRRDRVISFSLLWFIVGLLPVSNLYPINAYMAEHWLYLPSIGFFLIVAKGVAVPGRIENARIGAALLAAGLATFYSYGTIRQNAYWREPIALYERTLKYAPESAAAYNNLGYEYYRNGRKEEGVALLKKAIELDPRNAAAYYNLGNAYYGSGKADVVMALYRKAVELNPHYADAYNNLGIGYYDSGDVPEAIASFEKAIEINPRFGKAYRNLAGVYYHEKQYDRAIRYCDKALSLGFKVDSELLEALEPLRKK